MADLAQSAVTIERQWSEGGVTGKQFSGREVTLVLTAQGTVANKIPASVLQLSRIISVENFRTSADKLVVATPSYDRSQILLYDVQNATDANRDDPADFTATVRGIVVGEM